MSATEYLLEISGVPCRLWKDALGRDVLTPLDPLDLQKLLLILKNEKPGTEKSKRNFEPPFIPPFARETEYNARETNEIGGPIFRY